MAKRKFSLIEEVQKPTSEPNTQEIQSGKDLSDNVSKRSNAELQGVIKKDDVRATFIMDSAMVRRIKLIAALDKCKVKDVVASAFSSYIESWEQSHPMINLDAIDKIASK